MSFNEIYLPSYVKAMCGINWCVQSQCQLAIPRLDTREHLQENPTLDVNISVVNPLNLILSL